MVAFANLVGDGFAHCSGFPSSSVVVTYDSLLASLGPIAWWKLADPMGSGTVVDSSGNGWTGTVVGGVTLGGPGPIPGNTSALFNGSTGKITTLFNPTGLTMTTVIGWVKPTGNGRFVSNSHTDVDNKGYELLIGGGASNVAAWYVGNGTINSSVIGSTNLVTGGIWHMVVGTWDGVTTIMYVDAVAIGSNLFAGPLSIGADNTTLGVGAYGSDFLAGSEAEVAIFNTILTPAQIAALYALA